MEKTISIQELFIILKKKIVFIISIVLLFMVASALYSYLFATPIYQSTTQLLIFDTKQDVDDQQTPNVNEIQANIQLINTYNIFIKSPTILEEVIDELGLDFTSDELSNMISVSNITNTQIINLHVESSDRELAAQIANTTANVFKEKAHDLIRVENILISSEAKPANSPIKPRPLFNIMIAAAIGFAISAVIALLMSFFDNSVKSEQDLASLNIPNYGSIPSFGIKSPNKRQKRGKALSNTNIDPGSPIFESYRTIRTNIQFSADTIKTILITSADSGQGKSTTAKNLAIVFSQQLQKTLLIDADIRKPTLHEKFSAPNSMGLTNILSRGIKWVAVKISINRFLDVITCGPIPPNPSELLSSRRMKNLLESVKNEYDVIIIDSPPILPVTDALILSSICDGTLIVVRQGASKENLKKMKDQLANSTGKILGYVFNDKNHKNEEYENFYYRKEK